MQGLIDAAIAAASRNGVQAAVVLIGGAVADSGHSVVEHEHYHHDDQEATALRTQLEAANAALAQERTNLQSVTAALHQAEQRSTPAASTPAAQAVIDDLNARLAAAEQRASGANPMQSDALGRIAELEQQLAVQAASRVPGTGVQPAEVQSFDSYGIEHLALEPACEKLVRKHFDTIGALRAEFENLTTEDATKAFVAKTKLKKDYMVTLGVALLGKAPSAASKASGTASAAPMQGAGGAPDVPEGHADRTWTERLSAARVRETRMKEVMATVEKLRAKAQQEHPAAFTQEEGEVEGSLKLDALPKSIREDIQVEENTYNVVRGQMIACCWACNLRPPQEDSDITTIEQSLISAGLGHLAIAGAAAA